MKKYFFIILSLLMIGVGCKNDKQPINTSKNSVISKDSFNLSGTIYDCENCMLSIKYESARGDEIDSFKVANNKFKFKGKLSEPQLVELIYTPKKSIELFLANGEFSRITISEQSYKVVAGKTPQEYLNYKNATSYLDEEMLRIDEKYKSAQEANNKTAMDSLKNLIDNLRTKKQESVKDFITENPSSQVGVYALITTYYGDFNTQWLEQALMALDTTIHTQHDWKYLRKEVLLPAKATEIGKIPPQFDMKSVTGRQVKLNEFKGKIVLIDFWASWCVPCRAFNKELVNIYSKYEKHGFEIISISLDTKEDNWTLAAEKDKISWTNFCDLKGFSNQAAASYGIKAIPASFLIDQQGHVINKHLKSSEIENILDQYLIKKINHSDSVTQY